MYSKINEFGVKKITLLIFLMIFITSCGEKLEEKNDVKVKKIEEKNIERNNKIIVKGDEKTIKDYKKITLKKGVKNLSIDTINTVGKNHWEFLDKNNNKVKIIYFPYFDGPNSKIKINDIEIIEGDGGFIFNGTFIKKDLKNSIDGIFVSKDASKIMIYGGKMIINLSKKDYKLFNNFNKNIEKDYILLGMAY